MSRYITRKSRSKSKIRVEVHETWYGDAEVNRTKTTLWVRLLPGSQSFGRDGRYDPKKEFKLVIDWVIPVPGPAVFVTKRWVIVDREWYMNQKIISAEIDVGLPVYAFDVTFNPTSRDGAGQGRLYGQWPCKLVRVRRRSRWEKIRARSGPKVGAR